LSLERIDGVRAIGLTAAAFVIVALTYWNSLDNGFHFDDEHSLTENPHIRSLDKIAAFFTDPQTFSRNPGSEMYRPLVVLSHALNFHLGGLESRGYHLVNLAVHLCCVGLLVALFVDWGWKLPSAVLAACLFGVHPLASEPVNYISSRSESMATAFVLASVILYSMASRKDGRAPLIGSLACFCGALMSKSSAIALLVILPLVDMARYRCSPHVASLWLQTPKRQWPYWTIGVVYLWGVRDLLSEALLDAPVRSLGVQLMTQCKAFIYYAKLLLLPYPSTVDHAFGVASTGAALVIWLCAMCVASVIYLVWRGIQRRDRSVTFLAWIGAALLPTAVVPLNVLVTERRLYLAVAVLIGFVVWQLRPQAAGGRFLVAVTLCLFVTLTVQRNAVWASEVSLWEHAVVKAPDSDRAHLRLGVAYRKLGRLDAAGAHVERALELQPRNAPALNNLGNIRKLRGDTRGAEAMYAQALAILPSYPEAMINLATVYNGDGKHHEALQLLQRAEAVAGRRPELLNNIGTTYLATGDFEAAVASFEEALEQRPEAATTHFNLGGALEGTGAWQRALASYESAIILDAAYAKPHYNLALLHERFGRAEAAISAYRRFLDLWQGDRQLVANVRQRLASLQGGNQ